MNETTLFDFHATRHTGEPFAFAPLRGHAVLVVNTASQCGFTPQLAGLQALQARYGPQGFTVVGFPSNEFGGQDPGSDAEIAAFCQASYGVTFPVMAKGQVNGAAADPIWQWLKGERPGILGTEAIKWNFTKFLVGRDGQVIRRYAPQDTPEKLVADIEAALAAP